MATSVKITCRYYEVREFKDNDITENKYTLISWLETMNSLPLEERYKNVGGIAGRLEEIAKMEDCDMYALNFMRTDNVSTSYKVRRDTPAEHIEIEVGEYIAKNTVCLYDPVNHIMMIQRNRGGYTESSISSYINSFWEEQKCALVPIREEVNITGDKAEYLKLDIRLANIKQYRPLNGSIFEGIIEGMNRIEGENAHLEITHGSSRKTRLNNGEVRMAIADLYENAACVSSARVNLTDDQITGVYDLFDNLCKDNISITISEEDKGCVKFEKLANRMNDVYSYEHAKDKVLNALRS